jgi:pectate lyase
MSKLGSFLITVLAVSLLSKFAHAQLVAFPGAFGYGRYSEGGRNGDLYIVDSTRMVDVVPAPAPLLVKTYPTGKKVYLSTFRAACEAMGRRTVIFRHGGTIIVKKRAIRVEHPYLTIAGESAPGGGIMLRQPTNGQVDAFGGRTLEILASNVIVRHLRFRRGNGTKTGLASEGGNLAIQNLSLVPDTELVQRIIVDHCSFSWATDENLTVTRYPRSLTIQHCIIAECLNASTHAEGPHSKGCICGQGTRDLTLYRNLFACNVDRNPKLNGANVVEDAADHSADFAVVNCVVYNPVTTGYSLVEIADHQLAGEAIPRVRVNYDSNFFRPGNDTPASLYEIQISNDTRSLANCRLALSGNIGPHRPNNSLAQWALAPDVTSSSDPQLIGSFEASDIPPTLSAQVLYDEMIMSRTIQVGATKPALDATDNRILNDVRTNSGAIIDTVSQGGGWKTYAPGNAYPDSDTDGMDDNWEMSTFGNLDKTNNDVHSSGYTQLERFLHSKAE